MKLTKEIYQQLQSKKESNDRQLKDLKYYFDKYDNNLSLKDLKDHLSGESKSISKTLEEFDQTEKTFKYWVDVSTERWKRRKETGGREVKPLPGLGNRRTLGLKLEDTESCCGYSLTCLNGVFNLKAKRVNSYGYSYTDFYERKKVSIPYEEIDGVVFNSIEEFYQYLQDNLSLWWDKSKGW